MTATAVTRLGAPVHLASAALVPPQAAWHPQAVLATLALAGAGAWAGARWRIPAGALLVPMFAAVLPQDTGLLATEPPSWLLAASYALVGWRIGLRFTPAMLRHAARRLPRMLAGSGALARFVARRIRSSRQCSTSGCCASPV